MSATRWCDIGCPETVRAYALEKLAESGERERIARRHAEYHLGLFERAEAEAETRPMAEWLAEYRPRIDNLRAALDWAFSPAGDISIGVALTAASVPLWVDLSMMAECRRHIERALARMDSVADLRSAAGNASAGGVGHVAELYHQPRRQGRKPP